MVFFCAGCAVTYKTAPTYTANIKEIRTIAVMPPEIEVYQLTAGGVREMMDEWSQKAEGYTRQALSEYFSSRPRFDIKFVEEDWLESNQADLWRSQKALLMTVAQNILVHAYEGPNFFPTKAKNFDYTFGEEIQDLSTPVAADALLFVYGYDHESTVGRKLLSVWNFMLGAAAGVTILPNTPSGMLMALVNGKTGAVEWFNTSPPAGEYSFVSQRHIDGLIKWLMRDFIPKKR